MKINFSLIVLIFLTFNFIEANDAFSLNSKQINEMIKSNTLYIINIDEKQKWNENTVNVKNFQTIGKGLLEYKYSKLDFNSYKKDTVFVVSSKKDFTSIEFVQKLKSLGFKNVSYLKDENNTWNEILINFRGIKSFSMFKN